MPNNKWSKIHVKIQVLTQVKGKLEAFASSCPDYVQLCDRANQFLLQRESEDPVKPEDKKFDLKELEAKIKRKKEEAEKVIILNNFIFRNFYL